MRQSDFELASAPAPEPVPTLARGTAVGRFVVLGLVGRGAMGEVYGAYDPELDRKIAIKLLRPGGNLGSDGSANRTRLMREAQATAKISHPNVVIVYDAGTFGDRVFIAMEFVEGHTLRFWLQAQERRWHEILDTFLAAGRGLAAAHDRALVHRDFKPDNVMVTAQSGEVRVMDFGLARNVGVEPASELSAPDFEATMELATGMSPLSMFAAAKPATAFRDKITATGALLGTPAYMSPEQFRGQQADARSDQFSFCVALYEAMYGQRPFTGRSLQELAANVVAGRLSDAPASQRVPTWVREVLERGLRADAAQRFPSMGDLLAELDRRSSTGRKGFATGAAVKLAGVWEAPVGSHPVHTAGKARMRETFLATGKSYAAAVFAGASAVLDRYAQRWTELYVEVCEATHVRGEQSGEILDLRMACLEEGLDDLRALCRLFSTATGEVVENAVKAANALGTLERCTDIKLLRAVVRLPEDPAKRAEVEALRARLVDARALSRVGKATDGLAAVVPLIEEARRVGHATTLAEILLLSGKLHLDVGRDGTGPLEEAVWTAEVARHEEVAAEAACNLIYLAGYHQARFDVGEIWSRLTEAILRRMGGHELLWAWYHSNRACMREQQGRLTEAIEDARHAVALQEGAFGPSSAHLATCLLNLANHLAFTVDFEGALEVNRRAVEIMTETLGRDHPQTAISMFNRAQYLVRLGRFVEATPAARVALGVLERETDPRGILVTFAMRTLGLCCLGTGRFEEAASVLSRALALREEIKVPPLRLAEVRAPLARALFDGGGDRGRALALARQALSEYAHTADTPVVARDRAELEEWLGRHAETARSAPPPRRAAKRRKKAIQKAPAKSAAPSRSRRRR